MAVSHSLPILPRLFVTLLALLLLMMTCGVTPGTAQTRPASVAVTSGLASGDGETGASIGGAFAWDFSPRLVVETGAVYAVRGNESHAWSADARMLVTLVQSGRARPYTAVGVGIYRAVFDLNRRFEAFMRQQVQGRPLDAQSMLAFMNQFGPMNGFYVQRMNARFQTADWGVAGVPGGRMHESFTDPAVSLGAGVRLDLGSRLIARPEARMLVVLRNGRSQTVGLFTMDFGVRF